MFPSSGPWKVRQLSASNLPRQFRYGSHYDLCAPFRGAKLAVNSILSAPVCLRRHCLVVISFDYGAIIIRLPKRWRVPLEVTGSRILRCTQSGQSLWRDRRTNCCQCGHWMGLQYPWMYNDWIMIAALQGIYHYLGFRQKSFPMLLANDLDMIYVLVKVVFRFRRVCFNN